MFEIEAALIHNYVPNNNISVNGLLKLTLPILNFDSFHYYKFPKFIFCRYR